ncbi:MAG: rhomboid family intramembrane serine protease [Gemmatimonadota bacterium]|nr:rhomboid family intramembrane serine protease [Gemmatimonadota bacterium]
MKRLLIANGVIFLLTLAFSGMWSYLAFTPAEVLRQPWTPLTYMFVHQRFFHLLFNMLGLFFFGPPLEERWGSTEFLKFYLVCGVGGAILSLLMPQYPIIGASAAVYGVMLAYAMYWPDNPIYIWGIIPVKAKWLVTFFIGMSLFYALTGGAPGIAHLAHLGGCAAAFLYLKSNWGPTPYGPRVPQLRKRSTANVVSTEKRPAASAPGRRRRTSRPPSGEEELLDDIDRILDKISAHGLTSLTDEERRRLDEASRKYRTS